MRRELIDRFDALVPFFPLDYTAVCSIIRRTLERDLKFIAAPSLSETAYRLVIHEGYSPERGVAGLPKVIERLVVEPVHRLVEAHKLPAGASIAISAHKGAFTVDATRYKGPLV